MIPLSLGFSKGRSGSVSQGVNINVYPVTNSDDAKLPLTLTERPGLKRFLKPGSDGDVRAMLKIDSDLYSLVGNKFHKNSTDVGTVYSSTGKVWIGRNANYQIMVVAGGKGSVYNWRLGTFGQITDTDFPGSVSFGFLNQYAISVDPGSGRLRNSELNDFTLWDGTAFTTAESAPDNLLSVIVDHQEVIGFGEETVEIYRDTGDSNAVLQRLEGAIFEVGINAGASPAKVSNVVLWLDNSLQVRVIESYSPRVVSTDAINYQISKLSRTDDAVGMGFVWHGHAFYVLTFPSANRTFAYDLTSSAKSGRDIWHELASFPDVDRWRGSTVYQDGSVVYVGDHTNGWIYTLNDDTHTDNLEHVSRTWTTAPVFDGQLRRTMFHDELELEVEMGAGPAEDPQVIMQYSDDNGKTWSDELWSSIGRIGDYQNRARWSCLGGSKNRTYRFTVTDDVKLDVVGVYLYASYGDH
jgi:hypothetical protein